MDLSFLTSEQLAGLQFLAGELSIEDYITNNIIDVANAGFSQLKTHEANLNREAFNSLPVEDQVRISTIIRAISASDEEKRKSIMLLAESIEAELGIQK